jgi:S1-C subfamily serine protease
MLDLLIAALAVSAGVAGWQLGFLARVASWVSLVAGVVVGVVLTSRLVRPLEVAPALVVVLAMLVLFACAVLFQTAGHAAGTRLRCSVPDGPARALDRATGALASVVGVLFVVWLLSPMLAVAPGGAASITRASALVGALDALTPSPPDSGRLLEETLGAVPFPEVFGDLARPGAAGPAPAGVALPEPVVDRVAPSTVKVAAAGCRTGQEGSGFVAAPGLVVTNAHVVAGAEDVAVRAPGERRVPADVVAFDDDRDLALVLAPALDADPLALAESEVGTRGAVFGHPGGQEDLRLAPASVHSRIVAVGHDIYGVDSVRRRVLVLSAELEPGDSGGALVDGEGRVLGVAFAVAPDQRDTAYALAASDLQDAIDGASREPVPTGACV